MPTLHLLPGEASGDNADIVLNPKALSKLRAMLDTAERDGHACSTFNQRDGVTFELCIDVIDQTDDHYLWRTTRLSYMRRHARHILRDHRNRDYDADLLAAHLYAARRAHRHTQTDAAAAMGTSAAFVSKVENCQHVPKPESWEKLLAYIGTDLLEYEL